MGKRTITRLQARRFLLAYQGLLPPYGLRGKQGILGYIRRVGCIQYDPLNVVGHNQELVLQSRVADFHPPLLDELLYGDRLLVEEWDKNMSIYSASDWPLFHRTRRAAEVSTEGRDARILKAFPEVRRAFGERGPLSSTDLTFHDTVDWSWSPTTLSRAVLESMYFAGELVIHHRTRTRKTYDLATRCLPQAVLEKSDSNTTEGAYHEWRVLRRIDGIGLLWNRPGDAWLGMHSITSAARAAALKQLLQKRQLVEVQVGDASVPFYINAREEPLLEQMCAARTVSQAAAVLAPLDNLLWDRKLIRELFDFDYTWEVYKPVRERQYGYYVLPVLYGDRFVARVEPRYDGKSKTLNVSNWWWEQGVRRSKHMETALQHCLEHLRSSLGAQDIRLDGAAEQKKDLHRLIPGA
ncbi:MAG: crosslink repair DNA glycosylase YcaQ family protein [Patescibacteria group bacterium]|jgi:hypothetical protein